MAAMKWSVLIGSLLASAACWAPALHAQNRAPAAPVRADGFRVQVQRLGPQLTEQRVYFGKRLVYVGREQCEHLQRCGPVGLHRVYHLNGKPQRVMDYRVSRTHQFEGVPDRERSTTWLDAAGRPARVTHARRCTECDWAPYGSVRVRQANGAWQKIDPARLGTAEQIALEAEAQDNNYWPPLLGNPFESGY